MPRRPDRDLMQRLAVAVRAELADELASEAAALAGRRHLSPADRTRLAAVRGRVAELRGLRLVPAVGGYHPSPSSSCN